MTPLVPRRGWSSFALGDGGAAVLAAAAVAGALLARPAPYALALITGTAGVALRRLTVVAVAVAVGTSALAAASWSGLHPPVIGNWSGVATLAGDPQQLGTAVRVDLEIEGKLVEAWARGRAAGALRPLLSGERVTVDGTVRALDGETVRRLARRHVGGRMSVASAALLDGGHVLDRAANRFRRSLVAGAASLSDTGRSLFTGFVIGDNRGQPAEVVHDFRASGLTHLLVVSGQNVAFVLGLAAPALRRLPAGRFGLSGRLAGAVAVLAVFGTITRWDSSVLRAVGMAVVALVATTVGRPATARRTLALAVTVLVVVDPLLVHSLGFTLSVGASAGLVLLAGPLARAIPGPRALASALATTVAAQAGVTPLLVTVFGGVPVAGIAANLLAVPVAGPLMTWGLTAGSVAGAVGGRVAEVLHVPTAAAVGWEAAVARAGAALPLGTLRWPQAVVAATGIALAVGARSRGRELVRRAGVVLAGAAMLAPTLLGDRTGADLVPVTVADGATLWSLGTASVLVLDGPSGQPDWLLAQLHRHGVDGIGVVVGVRGTRSEAAMVTTVGRRIPIGAVLGPAGHSLGPVATAVHEPTAVALDAVVVAVEPDGTRLAVAVTRTSARGPAGSLAAHDVGTPKR